MTSSTANNDPTVKPKFGDAVYKMAYERAQTAEGKAELKGYSMEQFLDILKRMADQIDELPDNYTIHVLYLVLNYLGSMVVATMEKQKETLMRQTGGNA